MAASAAPPPPRHDLGEVSDLADDILARDEFQNPSENLIQRIGSWIAEHLQFDPPLSGGSGSGGSSVLTVVLLALALAGLAYALRVLLRQPRRRRRMTDAEPEIDVEVAAERSAGQWIEAAAQHEAAGRWKEGLRCRFRALLGRLSEGGVVAEIPGRTTGEYRADIEATAPQVSEEFSGAADLFDRAWYGDVPTGADESRRFAEHAVRVVAGVGGGPSPQAQQ